MKKFFLLFASMLFAFGSVVFAQGGSETIPLTGTRCGTTYNFMANGGVNVTDDNAGNGGVYGNNTDCYIVLEGTCESPYRLSLTFQKFDIHPSDTLFVYDGTSPSAPLLYAVNNNNSLLYQTIYAGTYNTTNSITLRFKSDDSLVAEGFNVLASCKYPCESVTSVIDDIFYKVRDGIITDTCQVKLYTTRDTAYIINERGDTTIQVSTETWRGVNLCLGEDVIFQGHGVYSHDHGFYNPSDLTTEFHWNLGNGTIDSSYNATQISAHYTALDCYDVILTLTDEGGCMSTNFESVKVRLAQNPIKTIFDLATICNTDSLPVNVGYEGENGTVTLKKIEFEKIKTKINAAKTFIPDGRYCETPCYVAPVIFDDFPSGRAVNSKEDICSICINFEHEYMGDYTLAIICPTNQTAYFKYKDNPGGFYPGTSRNWPTGTYGGGGMFNGYPYAGNQHHTYDGGTGQYCDSTYNMFGVGLDYCFSRNKDYTLVTGDAANTSEIDGNFYIASQGSSSQVTYTFVDPLPAPFQKPSGGTQGAGTETFTTKNPSNHADKTDYYLPADDFSTLVGCPLNGEWDIEVCDTWQQDNGWIFNWSMDICGISSGSGCEYQVGLDSITWTPDSAYGDWYQGRWRGCNIRKQSPLISMVSARDTSGTFPIHVTLYDEFDCVWDTTTKISVVWTPEPDLGNDTVLCNVESVVINAADRHTPTEHYSFMWEPFGQETDTIHSQTGLGSSTLYTVQVENEKWFVTCRARDSIRVNVNRQPTPNFDPGVYPLEGCEPFTINIQNMSLDGDTYRWEFGDGDTSTAKNPTHTYSSGKYGFKFYVASENGCKDSLIYDDLITVYPSPEAGFSWEPVNPTVLNPHVQFTNMTNPLIDENKYYWEIMYDRDNHISYHTLTDVNPSFDWYTDGEDISGSYIVRLIAKTNNLGPSGNIVECRDTVENTIVLVNDFLQFPNVITANGDGINDKFIIKNLVDGMGYPNNSLAIYNRWGERVYYKENISSEDDFWDPAKDHMPAGTYFWRFNGKGYSGNIQRTGSVEVLLK